MAWTDYLQFALALDAAAWRVAQAEALREQRKDTDERQDEAERQRELQIVGPGHVSPSCRRRRP